MCFVNSKVVNGKVFFLYGRQGGWLQLLRFLSVCAETFLTLEAELLICSIKVKYLGLSSVRLAARNRETCVCLACFMRTVRRVFTSLESCPFVFYVFTQNCTFLFTLVPFYRITKLVVAWFSLFWPHAELMNYLMSYLMNELIT